VAQYRGRIVKLTGDGALFEFASAVDAVTFAVEMQCAMRERNCDVPKERRIDYRVGINIGDIFIEPEDIYGDGVNIAARLEALADPGGICVARNVFNQVKGKFDLTFKPLGERKVKNIPQSVSVYRLALDEKAEQLVTPVETSGPVRRNQSWLVAASITLLLVVGGLIWWVPWKVGHETITDGNTVLTLPGKPSIVVLPLNNLSSDPRGNPLADGVTETITATLGQVPALFVISRNSAFTYKNKAVRVEKISRELGVRYVLEGSVQRVAERVRITVRLIDGTNGQHLWAKSYDRSLQDIFALQDEIAFNVLLALQVKLTEGELANIRSPSTGNIEAYLRYVQALASFRTFNKHGMVESRGFAKKSLALDPAYASALILTAWTHVIDARFNFAPRDAALGKADRLLLKVERQNQQLPNRLLGELLMARAFAALIQGHHKDALSLGSEAVALAPNNAFIVAVQGMILVFTRRYEEATNFLQQAMRLSPTYPSWYPLWLSTAYTFRGKHQQALEIADRAIDRAESNFMKGAARVRVAFAYADQGNVEMAKKTVEQIRVLAPFLTIKFYRALMHFENEDDWERFARAMRKAGLPE
jgi:TolB-like protein